jgi:hypothetical protein
MHDLIPSVRSSFVVWLGIALLVAVALGGAHVVSHAFPIIVHDYAEELRQHEANSVLTDFNAAAPQGGVVAGAGANNLESDGQLPRPTEEEESQR